jgi:hypothetical protein
VLYKLKRKIFHFGEGIVKDIYLNNERYLVDELLNLFVRLTKVTHTAHFVLATSDSYFIEEIYTNAKLQQSSQVYLVDHLDQPFVEAWLKAENLAWFSPDSRQGNSFFNEMPIIQANSGFECNPVLNHAGNPNSLGFHRRFAMGNNRNYHPEETGETC